jgi:hypothetical protein
MRRNKNWIEQLQVHHLRAPDDDFLDDSFDYRQFGGMPTKIDKEFTRIENDLKQTFSRLSMTDGAQRTFMSVLSARVLHAPPPPFIADKVPLWMDRADRKETPPDFIKRVYAQRLGNGLIQADILHLDKQLYFAFHKWLRSNPMPADLDLPTRQQVTARLLESAGNVRAPNRTIRAAELDPQTRIQQRAYDTRRYRAKLG